MHSPTALDPFENGYVRLFELGTVNRCQRENREDFVADPAEESREWIEAVASGQSPGEGLPPFLRCEGKKLRDLMGTTARAYLISRRWVEVLRASAATGWEAYPVEVGRRDGSQIEGYSLLSVTGRCGPPFNARANKVWTRCPMTPGYEYNAAADFYFDPASWDGSDLFLPSGTWNLLCTERVKSACEKARLTGIRFSPFATIAREGLLPDDVSPLTTWSAASFRCVG